MINGWPIGRETASCFTRECSMRIFIIVLTVFFHQAVMAGSPPGQYVPKGMHDYTYYTLDNGAGVILHEDHSVPTVTFRVVVKTGSWYFDKNKHEIAHILEHMLFMGTSKYSEAELEDLVQFNGGSWNAQTDPLTTDYYISIHADRLKTGIDIFYEIFTDATLSEEHFEDTIAVIEREQGQEIGAFRRWLYEKDLIYDADDVVYKQMFNDIKNVVPLQIYSEINYVDVIKAFKDYYVPENYLIIASGDFSQQAIRRYIQDTFGTITAAPSQPHIKENVAIPDKMVITESRFEPLMGTDSTVKHFYPNVLPGEKENLALLDIVEEYLDDVLFKKLRFENALAYTPDAGNYSGQGRGFFGVDFDAHVDNYEDVIAIYNPIIERLANGGEDVIEEMEKYRMKHLLKVSQYHYTAEEISEWYASHARDIKQTGEFYYDSYWIEQADVRKIPALVKQIFLDQPYYIAKSEPTLGISTAYAVIGGVILALIVMIIIFIRHHSLKFMRKNLGANGC